MARNGQGTACKTRNSLPQCNRTHIPSVCTSDGMMAPCPIVLHMGASLKNLSSYIGRPLLAHPDMAATSPWLCSVWHADDAQTLKIVSMHILDVKYCHRWHKIPHTPDRISKADFTLTAQKYETVPGIVPLETSRQELFPKTGHLILAPSSPWSD